MKKSLVKRLTVKGRHRFYSYKTHRFITVKKYHTTKLNESRRRATKTVSYKPEPQITGRKKYLGGIDVIKSGGVGKAFLKLKISKKIKSIPRVSGAVRALRVTLTAKDKRGRIIKDRTIKRDIIADKGTNLRSLVWQAQKFLKVQAASYGWIVSKKARKNKKVRGERISALDLQVEFIQEKAVKHASKRKKTIRGRHRR